MIACAQRATAPLLFAAPIGSARLAGAVVAFLADARKIANCIVQICVNCF